MPALICLHEGFLEGEPAEYTPISGKGRCSNRLDAQVHHMLASNNTGWGTILTLKHHRDCHTKSKIGTTSGPNKWTLVQHFFCKKTFGNILFSEHKYVKEVYQELMQNVTCG